MITDNDIDKIIMRADIVDVIGQFVDLKRCGVRYKACCPFHQEDTPSFMVDPNRGIWHCFGSCQEGGNVIKFLIKHQNMSFPEACRWLASRYNIILENADKPRTPQQEQEARKRESMFAINDFAYRFFLGNLQHAKASAAVGTIKTRWGEDFPRLMGIGYALPDWSSLADAAINAGYNAELMVELGLIRERKDGHGYYDFFRDRIMIPIRDRRKRIIGFTARDCSDAEGTPKYLNSAESLLYHKSTSVFGIDIAVSQARKEEKYYLVEGGPDVLRLQALDINNSVASLGGAWTKQQFQELRRDASKVCFIPDSDAVKEGEEYGPGISFVIKNGQLAMEAGFSVSVRELPAGAGNTKNDPDSYIKNRSIFRELEEEDFVLWYARHAYKKDGTTDEQTRAVTAIASMLAQETDELKAQMYLDKIVKQYKHKTMWVAAINREKRRIQEEKGERAATIDREKLKKYGFFEEKHCYYSTTKDGEMQWSNFTMTPMFHIKDALNPKRMYRIKNEFGYEEIIELKQEDLISLAKFRQRVEGLGNFIWMASEKELIRLKSYLYEQTETAVEVVQMGWDRKGFYAFGNGVFTNEWHPADEYGIVRLDGIGNFYLPGASCIYRNDTSLFQYERSFRHDNYTSIPLRELCEKLFGVFGDNGRVGFCFLLAGLFKDIVAGCNNRNFPILNLFGPKGSGKSELGASLMAFFVAGNKAPNIQNSTVPALSDAVAQCSNALVHLDEFKNDIDIYKREFLKALWDGTGRNRMNMDKDKKREVTAVDSAVIVSGQEMATADIALFSRMVFLTFSKSEFTLEEKRRYDELVQIRTKGLTHLTIQILQHRPLMEAEYYSNQKTVKKEVLDLLGETRVEDRILMNWVVCLAAFRTLEGVLDVPMSYREAIRIVVDGLTSQNAKCKANNELANFWNVVSYLQQDGAIFIEGDYRIDYMNRFKSNIVTTEAIYAQAKPILRMRKNRIFMLYRKFGKMVGDSVLPESSLMYYLENSPEYMGLQPSVRFKNIQNGTQVRQAVDTTLKGVEYKKVSSPDRAMCFDYEAIRNNYGINLEVELDKE